MEMECISSRTILVFDGNDYPLWSSCMEIYLKDLGVDVWLSIINGHKVPKNPPIDPDEKKLFSWNSKALHTIMCGLSRTVKSKEMTYTTAKQVSDKLKTLYEGDDKVKQVKLQKYKA